MPSSLPVPAPTPDAVPDPAAAAVSVVERLRDGDHAAFEAVFRAHYALLHAVATRLAWEEVAEEIVQEVLFSLWERRETLSLDGDLRSFLLAAVRFRAASAVRHAQVRDRAGDAVAAFHKTPRPSDAALVDAERAAAVERAIARLPERCRMVFTLVRLEGLSYQETAAALGISPKTVDAQMGHALRRLRADLAEFRQ
jgi:RNA polymerase sigma-70 factor (ECF subfamily)